MAITLVHQWLLNDLAGSESVADYGPSGADPLPLWAYLRPPFGRTVDSETVTGYGVTFQSGNSPVEATNNPLGPPPTSNLGPIQTSITSPLSSVLFNASTIPSGATQGGSAQFQGPLPEPWSAANGFTVLLWVWPGVAANFWSLAFNMNILSLANTRSCAALAIGSSPGNYSIQFYPNALQSGLSSSGTGIVTGNAQYCGPFMLAATVQSSGIVFWAGGNVYNVGMTLTSTANIPFTISTQAVFDYITIGGVLGGGNGWLGNISNVCLFNGVLDNMSLLRLATVGAWGCAGLPTGQGMSKIASYIDLPSYWTNI